MGQSAKIATYYHAQNARTRLFPQLCPLRYFMCGRRAKNTDRSITTIQICYGGSVSDEPVKVVRTSPPASLSYCSQLTTMAENGDAPAAMTNEQAAALYNSLKDVTECIQREDEFYTLSLGVARNLLAAQSIAMSTRITPSCSFRPSRGA